MKISSRAPLALASLGLAVLPVRRGRKEPAFPHWQKHATADPDEVSRLFRGNGLNIGIATGVKSGCFVLDIDCKAIDGWATLGELEARSLGARTIIPVDSLRRFVASLPPAPIRVRPTDNGGAL